MAWDPTESTSDFFLMQCFYDKQLFGSEMTLFTISVTGLTGIFSRVPLSNFFLLNDDIFVDAFFQ